VVAEREQAERLREGSPEPDFWRRLARRFTPRASSEGPDPTVAAVAGLLRPPDTLLDVGAGGGRLAVPLARHCRSVVAVEPSEGMRKQLADSAASHGMTNIETVPSDWLSARVQRADVVLCAHVLYAIDDVEPFVEKLVRHATRRVAVVLQPRPPMSNFYPLWRLVHGEYRKSLPSLPEFLELLQSWRVQYDVLQLAGGDLNLFADFDDAVDYSIQRLFLQPGSAKAGRLVEVLKEVLVESDGGLRFRWSRPFRPRIVTWST
jgi:SAM-dependent methyltransferase